LVGQVAPSSRQAFDELVGEHEEVEGELLYVKVLVGERHDASYRSRERERERKRDGTERKP